MRFSRGRQLTIFEVRQYHSYLFRQSHRSYNYWSCSRNNSNNAWIFNGNNGFANNNNFYNGNRVLSLSNKDKSRIWHIWLN